MAYIDVQNQVLGLLNRRDATTAQVQAWIQLTIQRIQRELRVPAMEKTVMVTISAGASVYVQDSSTMPTGITIPSDLLELIDIISPDGIRLQKANVTEVLQAAQAFGRSSVYYRMGGVWLCGPAPQAADNYIVVYYAELAPLVNPSDTNIIVQVAPDLLTYGALSFAGDFYVDKRTGQWEQRYQAISQSLQDMADADENSGAAAVSMPVFWPDDGIAYGYP